MNVAQGTKPGVKAERGDRLKRNNCEMSAGQIGGPKYPV